MYKYDFYYDFVEDLNIGHEFHITIDNKQYSISNHNGATIIGEMNTDDFREYNSKIEMLCNHKINGKTLREQFENIQFNCIF